MTATIIQFPKPAPLPEPEIGLIESIRRSYEARCEEIREERRREQIASRSRGSKRVAETCPTCGCSTQRDGAA